MLDKAIRNYAQNLVEYDYCKNYNMCSKTIRKYRFAIWMLKIKTLYVHE